MMNIWNGAKINECSQLRVRRCLAGSVKVTSVVGGSPNKRFSPNSVGSLSNNL